MNALRKWRTEHNISLHELGRRAGITHTQVMRIERGHNTPRSETAKRIEAATNGDVTAAELLGLTEPIHNRGVRENPTSFEAQNAVTIPIPPALLEQARTQGLDVEMLVSEGGVEGLRKASKQAFHEQNKDAIEWTSAYVRKHGTLSQQFGMI